MIRIVDKKELKKDVKVVKDKEQEAPKAQAFSRQRRLKNASKAEEGVKPRD